MAMTDDILSSILKGAYPDASDEDIANQITGLKKSGSAAIDQALNFIPGMGMAKDIAVNSPALLDAAANTDIGKSVSSAVTGGPVNDFIPNPGNPIDSLSQGLVAGGAKAMFDPTTAPQNAPNSPEMAAPAPMSLPDLSAPPSAPEMDAAKQPSAPTMPAKVPSQLPSAQVTPPSPITIDPTEDQRRREANDAALEHRRRMQAIPNAIAGVGDAIASGAKAFGVNNATDTQAKLQENQKEGRKEDKEAFELKLKQDPNSDISKSYRTMVQQIVPDLAKNPNFGSMSAQAIGEKLPMIDTVMKAQAQKDAKELGLKQLQTNKDISLGLKDDQQQDKLEHDYKQQLMSVRGDPNISSLEKQRDAAAQAYNLVRDSQRNGKSYDLSEPQMVELYGQLYLAMTGRGLTGEALHAMNQATGKQKTAALATFLGMSPSATTDAIGDRLKHMTTTLGMQVQSNIDKRMESRLLPPSGLRPERAEPIKKSGRGYTFQELVNQSDDRATGQSKPKLSKDSLGLF